MFVSCRNVLRSPAARSRAGFGVQRRMRASARTAVDLRALKEEQIAIARERVFGPQGSLPGDRQFRKPLEGKKLMRWYFPSKYNMQDFRTEDYYEMQAERFAPREPHESMQELTQTLEKVVQNREVLRKFFSSLDEVTFNDNHSLQDLYGLFRLMDGDRALNFAPDEKVFKEHSPFGGPSPLLRVAAAKSSAKDEEPSEEAADADAEVYDLAALWLALGDSLPREAMSELEAKMSNTHSLEAIRELITGAMKQHNFVPDVGAATASLYTEERAEDPAVKVKAAARAHEEASTKLEELLSKKEEGAEDAAEATIQAATDAKVEAQEALHEATEQLAKYHEEAKEWRQRYVRLPVRPRRLEGAEEGRLAAARRTAEEDVQREKRAGDVASYLARRHRFVDPMFRRRRLKWLERQNAGLNNETEVKFNNYYSVHADNTAQWPTNRGSVHHKWPSPYH